MNHHLSDCFKCLMAWTHRLRLGVKVAKASSMLGVGQDLVVHHTKASVLAGSILPRLQHVEVHLLLGVVESLADALATGFVALHAPAAVGLTIETHKTISFPFHLERPGLHLSKAACSSVSWCGNHWCRTAANSSFLSGRTSSSNELPARDM